MMLQLDLNKKGVKIFSMCSGKKIILINQIIVMELV